MILLHSEEKGRKVGRKTHLAFSAVGDPPSFGTTGEVGAWLSEQLDVSYTKQYILSPSFHMLPPIWEANHPDARYFGNSQGNT